MLSRNPLPYPSLCRSGGRRLLCVAALLAALLAEPLAGLPPRRPARAQTASTGGSVPSELLREGDATWGWFLLPITGAPGGIASLYIDCRGSGTPTVVLDAGLNDFSAGWGHDVPDDIASYTRVCRYDRANTGRSMFVGGPRTSQDVVEDLHALLAAARDEGMVGNGPPYLLVGHSFGGANVRLFASRYPEGVAGLVLLDPTALDVLPAGAQPEIPPIPNFERIDLQASVDQLRAAAPLPDVPLVVVTADLLGFYDLPQAEQDARLELHRALAVQVPRGVHVLAEHSDHYIHVSRPDVVTQVIRQVVQTIRDSG